MSDFTIAIKASESIDERVNEITPSLEGKRKTDEESVSAYLTMIDTTQLVIGDLPKHNLATTNRRPASSRHQIRSNERDLYLEFAETVDSTEC